MTFAERMMDAWLENVTRFTLEREFAAPHMVGYWDGFVKVAELEARRFFA